ncbi:MAG: hypothetical protein A3D31_03735 [Candidatus Fluviicola riflensis]|nr:MAG: hypothetical protein CHH17_11295 [Candidatus Fluviicola riflensis]OGS79089.1 MAG: hypothetical protein A3D31_03735 [Candidatus Fluviicola riflensis]OGS86112.1 MAG: hypothetical protein A3E30_11225 [Fluviicola sp. RIFCSPHIGHO2_12_FULL_43_24]OGS86521.1 MAG: hypothetical protein A2724_03195 [Fluviicola sp. RIFCSPHIGHO2_01_FULL_43_53]
MKNTITLLVAVLLIACCLPSCGATLIKRQHGPGYYINKNPGIPTAQSERSDNKHIKPSSTKIENPSEETEVFPEEQTALVPESNETITQLATNDQSAVNSEETALDNIRPANVENDQVRQVKPSLYEWSSSTRLAEKMKMRVSDDQSAQSGSAVHDGDGLSLFGIIILIILILWLVGAISGGWGLGGLIHILLVIALILLILWLLRII